MRTRHVVDTGEVAHLWAHKAQGHARNKRNNFYFNGESIYSYGSHFEAGRLVTRNGQTVALITNRRYSSTTAGHVSCVRGAVSHMRVFEVPLGSDYRRYGTKEPREWFKSYIPRVQEALDKASRARLRRTDHFADAKELTKDANDLARFFGLKDRLTLPEDLDAAIAAAQEADRKQRQREKARLARQERERKRREAEARRKLLEEDLPKWRRGELQSYNLPGRHLLEHACLRINGDRTEIETTKGASFPLEHGERAYRVLRRLREKGQSYQRNGHTIHVGHYGIDRMDAHGAIEAGCHTVTWDEVELLARAAGWANTVATN